MELLRSTSYRGFSVRRIFMFALTVLFTALLGALTLSAPTHAAPAADWKGESILYNGDQFFGPVEAKSGESHGLANGTIYYLSVEQVSERPLVQKAHVIYFAPGTSPPTETSANYAVYDYSASKVFSNPQDRQTITLTPQGDSSSYSSCSVDGIGWIICPVTVFLADAMDNVFEFVSNFMAVQPLNVTDPNSPLYTAWNVMRSIANVAFIIAFMIIIYSQLTGAGISSYGLKKLLPRLVVAAILVNVSFYITAIAVDLSNIAGYSLQDILIKIRQDTFAITDSTWDASNGEGWGVEGGWSALTTLVLSGGAAAAGFAGISAATGGSIGAALYLLIPILIGLLLTILLVLLILAARQAIIIILIVIAPLAFVANLLPNTEKWFDKWRDLFMTMLIFFPAFSLVFGGSQLAGGIIIQNSTNIIMIIFGMAVQIAPLVITPLLLKLSGSLLGRIAQIANDPSKGLLDRTKNWSKDRAEMNRQRSLANTRGRANPFRSVAKSMDRGNRFVKNSTHAYEQAVEADAMEHDEHKMHNLHVVEKSAELRKSAVENRGKEHVQNELNITGSKLHLENVRLEASNIKLNEATERTKADIEEYKTGRRVATGELNTLMGGMKAGLIDTTAETQRAQSAQFMQQKNTSTAFTDETVAAAALARIAGGVDPNGIIRAQANASAALNKLEKEALDNSVQLLNVEAIKNGTTLKNYAVKVVDDTINNVGIRKPPQVIEAALEAVAQDGQVSILREARMSGNIDQNVLTKLFARNAGTMKEKGGFDLQADPGLAGVSREVMNASIAATIGEVTGENIPKVKAGFWGDVSKNISDIINDAASVPDSKRRADAEIGLRKAYITITEALQHEDAGIQLGDRMEETIAIHEALQAKFNDPSKAVDYDKHRVN